MESTLDIYLQALRQSPRTALSDEQLQWFKDNYPFFALPFATTAAAEPDPSRRQKLMERVALVATDREMLFRLTDPDGEKMSRFYPDRHPDTPDTDSAIDTFLNTYGRRDPREEVLLERLIFNPVADYSAVLEREAEQSVPADTSQQSAQDAQLDAFLASRQTSPSPQPAKPTPTHAKHGPVPAPAADSSLTESLAKIYISQKRYDKAYEIIKQLSLNFPKKSIYFADQLRFLEKLMRNQQYLNKEK